MIHRDRRERGNIGTWAVLSFVAVAGFMALSIHAGRSYSNRVELQNAADAAALAAAAQLDGTQAGIDAATEAAAQFGAAHLTENVAVGITAADLTFGNWDRATQTFTEVTGRGAADLRSIIAVQVRDARLTLPVGFGAFLGGGMTTSVRSSAVAVGGGPCDDHCAFPGAFADCMLVNPDGSLNCDERFYVLNSDWQDNLGLTSLDPAQPANVPSVRAALNACVESSADTPVPVMNGNPIQPVFRHSPSFPMEVVAPVVHAENCFSPHYQKCTSSDPTALCPNPRFNHDMTIVGYISIIVCYVTDAVVHRWPPARPDAPWGPTASSTPEQVALWNECGPAPLQTDFPGVPNTEWPNPFLKQTIFIKHRCHWIDPGNRTNKAGCQSFGLWTSRSRLVQ
jgi:Flp pilus assembly protein TadG